MTAVVDTGPSYFEDLEVGLEWRTAARTVTESDLTAFAGVSGDFNPIHTDAVYAATTAFGERIAHGALVLAIATGLRQQDGRFRGTLKAWLGMSDWRFRAPVRVGDTIAVENRILDLRRREDDGVAVQGISVVNQRQEVVADGEFVTLMKLRGQEEVSSDAGP